MKKIFACTLCLLFLIDALRCEQTANESFLDTLNIIESIFQTNYAPAEWKKEYINWDVSYAIEESKQYISRITHPTLQDYQYAIGRFFSSTKDFHVSPSFYSTAFSFLPFRLEEVEGRYFVVWKDIEFSTNLQLGDEVLEYNDQPIDTVISRFAEDHFGEQLITPSDRAMATAEFTFRAGRSAHKLPKGKVILLVNSKNDNKTYECQFNWIETVEHFTSPFKEAMTKKSKHISEPAEKKETIHKIFRKQLHFPRFDTQQKALKSCFGFDLKQHEYRAPIGRTESHIPPFRNITWQTMRTDPIQAYIFSSEENKKIGFVRIATYMCESSFFDDLRLIIARMEKETDALIVDQTNNPGGILFYMYAVASLLTEKPLTVPIEEQPLTQDELDFALEFVPILETITSDYEAKIALGSDFFGYPVTTKLTQQITTYLNAIIDTWKQGKQRTAPMPFFGIDKIEPHKNTRYSKPIVLLINELDFSCGDYFPAIFQDNDHATIVGTTTAGAGGSVSLIKFPNLIGLETFSYTTSLGHRLNGRLIENLGVTPDITLKKTVDDVRNGYKDYKKGLMDIVNELIKEPNSDDSESLTPILEE